MTLTFDLELMQNVSRGTDNLRANFGFCATFLCRVMGKLTDELTLLPGHLTCAMSVMRVVVLHLCTKFEVRLSPLRNIWHIFRLSINAPRDFDL